jgi:hypothetical protein
VIVCLSILLSLPFFALFVYFIFSFLTVLLVIPIAVRVSASVLPRGHVVEGAAAGSPYIRIP